MPNGRNWAAGGAAKSESAPGGGAVVPCALSPLATGGLPSAHPPNPSDKEPYPWPVTCSRYPPPPTRTPATALLRSWLERQLGPDGHAAAKGRLSDLAAEVTGPLRAAHADAEAHPPTLVRYDAWGARVDRIDTSAGWQALRAAAARHAVVALPYQAEARAPWGAAARVVQHALLHLYGPESATFSCPVAMADGAAALLSRPEVDPASVTRWLPRLTSTDPADGDHQRAVDDRVAGRLRPGPLHHASPGPPGTGRGG